MYTKNNYILLALIGVLLASCASRKDIAYFQDLSSFETMVDTDTFVPRFKVGDKISISITSEDPIASAPFNMVAGASMGEAAIGGQMTYSVDLDGNIVLPVLGVLEVKGLSLTEVKEAIRNKLIGDGHLKDPNVHVSLKSFVVTVLGQVNNPGTFEIEGQRTTILQVLGLAGDLTITGRRDNVLVMRDFNGTKVSTRIDLTKKEVLNSPVYYLTQNDVIYVEPNGSEVNSSKSDNRALTFSVASLLLTLTTTILVLTRN